MDKQVVVIGAGLGGLAAALRLRAQGMRVTVCEKLERFGGRSNLIDECGFRIDTGPTILVMKDAFEETYRSLGLKLADRLELTQIEPNYRIYFHDGTHLDLSNSMARLADNVEQHEPGGAERVFRFLGESARKYELGMEFVTRNYDRITDLANPRALVGMLSTKSYKGLYDHVAEYFESEKLRKAFSFHSMFLGLSPLDSPAMYALITYADLVGGMWYPKGGIYSVIEDLVSLAEERGVELRAGTEVARIRVERRRAVGVELRNGDFIPADAVVSNADLPYTYGSLIGEEHRKRFSDRRLKRMEYACSGYLLYLGLDRRFPALRHQGLFFSEDYRANLDAIFRTGEVPEDPSFHISCPTVTEPSLAPDGHSILYLLAPMPNLQAGIDWDEAAPVVREKLLGRLEELVHPGIREHIVWERQYTPEDFRRDVNAVHGTAFGSLAHGFFQSAYFRPHNVARDIKGLYFVGQGTYPGIGMPMVLISARLLAERVVRDGGA